MNTNARYRFRLRPQIARAFAKMNLSQNEFARRCGLTSGYMSQLLSGTRYPGPDVRRRLLTVLDPMNFDDVFEEVGE